MAGRKLAAAVPDVHTIATGARVAFAMPEREEGGAALVDLHGDGDARLGMRGERERRGARTGAQAQVPHAARDEARDEGARPEKIRLRGGRGSGNAAAGPRRSAAPNGSRPLREQVDERGGLARGLVPLRRRVGAAHDARTAERGQVVAAHDSRADRHREVGIVRADPADAAPRTSRASAVRGCG